MSWQPVDDINKTVGKKIKDFHKANDTISSPSDTEGHLSNIAVDDKKYKDEFETINDEVSSHQAGGKIRDVLSPTNMTAPTSYMVQLLGKQKQLHGILNKKWQKVLNCRENIEQDKLEREGEIRQLYTDLVEDFQKKRRYLDEKLYHRN